MNSYVDALKKLKSYQGKSLNKVCENFKLYENKNGYRNKGAVGITLRRLLKISNTKEEKNFNLKTVLVYKKSNGEMGAKETIALTSVKDYHFGTPFEETYLYGQIIKLILVARIRIGNDSTIEKVVYHDLTKMKEFLQILKKDYQILQEKVKEKGLENICANEGTTLLQVRTKGLGHGSTTKAFYFTKTAVNQLLGLNY